MKVRRVALSVLLAALPMQAHAARLNQHRVERSGVWRTEIVRNTFTGEIVCRMRSRDRRIIYAAQALGFRFPEQWDTTDATFRIDSGAAYRWRDQLPELARLQVPIDGRAMSSPTDGIVWLPSTFASSASAIWIQARQDKRPRHFDVRGFGAAYSAARARGCDPDVRFSR